MGPTTQHVFLVLAAEHLLDDGVDGVHSVLFSSFDKDVLVGVVNAGSYEALLLLRRG